MDLDNKKKLPKGWVWTRVGEISNMIQYGTSEKAKDTPYGIPVVRMGNIQEGKLVFEKLKYFPKNWPQLSNFMLDDGDVLFNRTNSAELVGKTAVYKRIYPTAVFASYLIRIKINKSIYLPDLLAFFINSFYGKKYITSVISQQVGQANVNGAKLSKIPIPLPPLAEQHRIVAKIEELFTKLDAGVDALEKVKTQLKCYRQAVLKYAFEGKLTQEWREKNKDIIEPAGVLLEKIKQERKQQLGKKYKKFPEVNTSELSELPEGWVWTRVEEIAENDLYAIVDGPFGSHLKTSDYIENGEIPVISISNIEEGFDKEKLRFISKSKYEQIKRSSVRPGDIIIAKIGSSYGKCGYYPEWMPIGIIPANLLKVTLHKLICKSYVYNYFKANIFKKLLDKIVKSTAQPAFNLTGFKLLYIPLPSLAEQHKIVEEIEQRFSIADEVEKIVETCLQQAKRLRQSILKNAFEGKLVPQNPNDEPAEKLLEKIKCMKTVPCKNTKNVHHDK